MVTKMAGVFAGVLALSSTLASAHGSHSESDEKDWATRHMQCKWKGYWSSSMALPDIG